MNIYAFHPLKNYISYSWKSETAKSLSAFLSHMHRGNNIHMCSTKLKYEKKSVSVENATFFHSKSISNNLLDVLSFHIPQLHSF